MYNEKCSDRALNCEFPPLQKIMTDRPTNRPGNREVSLPINKDGKGDMNEGIKLKEAKKVV